VDWAGLLIQGIILHKMLKQASLKNRTAFLQLFTRELIINSQRPIVLGKSVGHVGIPEKKEDKEPRGLGGYFASEKLEEEGIRAENYRPEKVVYKTSAVPVNTKVPEKRVIPKKKIIFPKTRVFPKKIIVPMKSNLKKKLTSPIDKVRPHIPSKQLLSHEIELGKLGVLIADKEITVIECPGADNFVLVKKAGKVHLTKIKLSQEEIDRVLDSFSAKARIPLMEGVFKAIVGDLSINAVITGSSGHRFMIYKKTPYSYLERC